VWQAPPVREAAINADLRPFYMLSTELISLPTGFIFR